MELQVLFDFDRWVSGDEREKKRGIADAIVDAVVATEAETLLPSGRFKSIRDEFVEVDFDTNWYHGTPKWNRKRDLCARIRMEHGLQSCSIVVEIAAQGQEVPQRHSIASAGPRDWAFVPFMGRIKWIGSRSLEYSAKALPAPIRIDA